MDIISCYDLNNGELLREITVKIGLEFARKQGFKLKKIKRPIYVRNVDRTFNKEKPIEHTVKINIYYP